MLESFTSQQWKFLSKFYKDPVRFKDSTGIYAKAASYIDSTYPTGRTFAERAAMHRSDMMVVPLCSCGSKVKFSESSYKWAKTCGQTCYLKNKKPSTVPVVVNGVDYSSVREAIANYSGSLYEALYDRENNSVKYKYNHDATCIASLRSVHPSLADQHWLLTQKHARRSIKDISAELGVSRESVTNAFAFHGISRSFDQLTPEARAILLDKHAFTLDYAMFGTDLMAEKYNCSPSTILSAAHEYNCPISKTTSSIELKMKSCIESLGFFVVQSDRKTIGVELDLVIPEKRLAIEFDGLYWHSERDSNTNKMRHKKKHDACNASGYTLLRFTDYETTNKLPIVQSMIQAKLGKSTRLHARECKVGAVDAALARKFFDSCHLQGHSTASVYIGLYSVGTLVMCISFSKSRFDKKYQWEIVRMASSLGTTVVGGASKILNEFLKTYDGSIMTYSDNRTGNGNGYSKLGFTPLRETSPGYFYSKGNSVYSRYKFQKSSIAKMCPSYDPTKTEYENAIANGYGRYWDCGNKVWVMQR